MKATKIIAIFSIAMLTMATSVKAQYFGNETTNTVDVTFYYFDNANPCSTSSALSNTMTGLGYGLHIFPAPPAGHTYFASSLSYTCGTLQIGGVVDPVCGGPTSTNLGSGACAIKMSVSEVIPFFSVTVE